MKSYAFFFLMVYVLENELYDEGLEVVVKL